MIIKEAISEKHIQDAFSIRDQVFIQEQGVSPEIEHDSFDKEAIHVVGYINNQPIAAARIRVIDQEGKIQRVSVLKSYRKKGYGQQLMEAIEHILSHHNLKNARLNAQTHALTFYESLGYRQISEPFYEAGIEHVSMEKIL